MYYLDLATFVQSETTKESENPYEPDISNQKVQKGITRRGGKSSGKEKIPRGETFEANASVG